MQSLHPYSPYPRSSNLDSRPDRTLQNTVIAVSKVALSILATLSAYLYLPTPLFLLTAVTCIIINIPAAQDQVARFIHYPPPTAEALSPRHLFTSRPTARRGESDTRASHTQVGSRGFDPPWDDFNHREESKTDQQLTSRWGMTDTPERDPSPRVYHPAGHPQDAAQNTLGRPLHAQAGRRVSDDQRATSQEEKGAEELAPFIQRQHSLVGFRK